MPGTVDYSSVRRARGLSRRIYLLAPIGAVLLAGALWLAMDIRRGQQSEEAMALASAWLVNGPPCPTLPALAEAPIKPDKSFSYSGATFLRRYGHVDCRWVEDARHRRDKGLAVCEFTGPAVLEVKTGKGDFVFQPGVGRPAVVSIDDGQPRCVIGRTGQAFGGA